MLAFSILYKVSCIKILSILPEVTRDSTKMQSTFRPHSNSKCCTAFCIMYFTFSNVIHYTIPTVHHYSFFAHQNPPPPILKTWSNPSRSCPFPYFSFFSFPFAKSSYISLSLISLFVYIHIDRINALYIIGGVSFFSSPTNWSSYRSWV